MPPQVLTSDDWKRLFRRALVYGPPNSWKTTSLLTWPRPLHVIVVPGEMGSAALPVQDDVRVYVWSHDPTAKKASLGQQVRELESLSKEILAGKHGPVGTIAVEGIHKAHRLKFDSVLDGMSDGDQEKFRGMAYGVTSRWLIDLLHEIGETTVPYFVATCWAEREKDDPTDTSVKAPAHVFPALPGMLSQLVLGEFGAVLHSEAGQELAPGKFGPGRWQTRKGGKVWGAGLKVPAPVGAKIPTFVPQDWTKLEELVLKEAS